METRFFLLFLNFVILMLCQAQHMGHNAIPSTSTSSYFDKTINCNRVLENYGKVNYDSVGTSFKDCDHVDYWMSVGTFQSIVVKLKFDVEKILKFKNEEIIFELFDDPRLKAPSGVVSRKDFNDPGETVKVLKFASFFNQMVLRVHGSYMWIPFTASYRPKGICLSDQQRCIGEDDCFDKSGRCDGVWDCLDNGSDELNCTGCINSYRCQNKSNSEVVCYRFMERCNGHPICVNSDDQRNCKDKQCNTKNNAFLCKNSKCIPSNWVCDGIDDCHDFSDEIFCSTDYKNQVTVIAVTGSVSCVILSIIIIWFSCKLYMLKRKRSRERTAMLRGEEALVNALQEDDRDWWEFFFRDCRSSAQSRNTCHHGQHVSPITEVQNEIFSRLSAPPPYQIAMATSRSFNEVMAEEMAHRLSEETGEHSDEELLNPNEYPSPSRRAESEDDSLLILHDSIPSASRNLFGNNTQNQIKKKKNSLKVGRRSSEEYIDRSTCNRIYDDEPPTFEEATGEVLESINDRLVRQVDHQSGGDSNCSDDGSGQVPPSYSSLFPSTQNSEQASNAAFDNLNQTSAKRFSFLKAPLQNLKLIFSRWNNSRTNSTSLTELIDGQQEFSDLDGHLEHEIQRIIMARNIGNIRAENQVTIWPNRNNLSSLEVQPLEDVANLMQWDIDSSHNMSEHSDCTNASLRLSNENCLLSGVVPQVASELEHARSFWRAISSDGIYEGDYNTSITSDSDNDEKDS